MIDWDAEENVLTEFKLNWTSLELASERMSTMKILNMTNR